eukprot:GEMP01044194.1.p3 GENE.GEMP01044194.1~~GEMP01044194.1.p3  ORF type:complete len:174 (+),score=39.41 GEMP01044194.1:677-1198(+)
MRDAANAVNKARGLTGRQKQILMNGSIIIKKQVLTRGSITVKEKQRRMFLLVCLSLMESPLPTQWQWQCASEQKSGAKDVSECSTINNTCKNSDVRAESTQSIGIEGENSDSHDWIAFVRTLETQRTVTRKEQLEAPAQPQLPPQQRAAICKESIVTIPRPSDVPFPCFWPFQ